MSTSGQIGGQVTGSISADIWLVSKSMASVGTTGSSTLSASVKPATGRSPLQAPAVVFEAKSQPCVVELYFGVKTMRKARSISFFKAKTFGPKTVPLDPGDRIRSWLGLEL